MLIRDKTMLSEVEKKFVARDSHLDFIIYNRMDKSPFLAVEVDGYEYHANNPEQLKKDRIKDGILKKYKIPLVRFSTIQSQEEKRLREKLTNIRHRGYC